MIFHIQSERAMFHKANKFRVLSSYRSNVFPLLNLKCIQIGPLNHGNHFFHSEKYDSIWNYLLELIDFFESL